MNFRPACLALVLVGLAAARAEAQQPADSVPELVVQAPAVAAFWRVPASDSVLEAEPDLASALDDQQYYWAETRDSLAARGAAALDQPGLRFRVRQPGHTWLFAADPDSADVGYLVFRPGRPVLVLYGVHFPQDLTAALADTATGP